MEGPVTIPELTEAVARVSALLGPREGAVVQLDGGITNRNFRVRFGGTEYVLRLPGKRTDLLGIDRDTECMATKLASELGFAPRVVTLLDEPACLVTTFVAGEPAEARDMRDPDAIAQVAAHLRALHESRTDLPTTFDPVGLAERYAATAREHGAQIPGGYDDALEAARTVVDAVRDQGDHVPVAAHNDLLPTNFLLDGGTVHLIDWEYAGMGDRWFDLGNFAANNEFGDGEETQFLEAYFGEPPEERALAALKLFRFVSDFREALWGTVQSVLSDVDFDFPEYAARHFERAEQRRNDPRFQDWLERVRGAE